MAIARPSTHGERLAPGNFWRRDSDPVKKKQNNPDNNCTLENSISKTNSQVFESFPVTLILRSYSSADGQCCGSGSAWIRNFCLDPDLDSELLFRIQQKRKDKINKNLFSQFRPVNSGLCVL